MSKVKIYGNPNPVIGIKQYYSIHDFFDSAAPSKFLEPVENIPDENIKWSVWILLGDTWTKMNKNNKTGATVDYTFTQTSLKRKGIRILVDANGEKAVLDIKTKKNVESKILHVEILDNLGKKPTKLFSYGETITARVHCLNMEKFRINVPLWENDGGKKDLSDISIEMKEANVLEGKADVKFTFDPSKVWLANAKTAPNELNEGAFHEYYVTAEFYKKVSKPTEDINVINPDYKVDILSKTSASKPSETEKPSPAEEKGPSKKETRGVVKKDEKAHDYQEQKVDVQPAIIYNPQQEFINSLMMVNVGDAVWNKKNGVCECKENNFYWSNKLTCEERKKVLQVCANLWGEANKKQKASELMSIIHIETGNKTPFKPYADNGKGFSGLIQFSDASAEQLGTTRKKLKAMTFIEQMSYVEEYFRSKKEYLMTMTDIYLLVVKRTALGKGNDPDYVLFDESISVPDGDGSRTSYEQRMININREPWVTKYGYASNPSFMKELGENTQREKWVYTRQRKEMRWGFHNGKTTVGEVTQELKENHYDKGGNEMFKGNCEDVQKYNEIEGRVSWMKIALEEAKSYGGKYEGTIDERIQLYHKDGGSSPGSGSGTSWCASFVCWCLEQSGNKSPKSAGSRMFLDSNKVEKCDVFYGAVAIFSDCDSTGTRIQSKGHATFIFGELPEADIYACLGGNQGDMLKISKYNCSGNVFISYVSRGVTHYKIFRGFYKPKGYEIKEIDKLNKNDKYASADEASKEVLKLNIKSNESGESS